jgi:hypothetical protein
MERDDENGDTQTTESPDDMAAAAYTNAGSKIEWALADYAAKMTRRHGGGYRRGGCDGSDGGRRRGMTGLGHGTHRSNKQDVDGDREQTQESQKVAAGPDLLLGHDGHVKHPQMYEPSVRRLQAVRAQHVGLRTPQAIASICVLVAGDRGG